MNLLDKAGLEEYRKGLKRPFGGVTSFLPTESQAAFIRMSLLKTIPGIEEIGNQLWYETGKDLGYKCQNIKTKVPVLVQRRDKKWLFLTHHILNKSSRDLKRGESDVLVEYGGGLRKFVGAGNVEIKSEDFEFNELGELIGGSWITRMQATK